MTTSPPRSIADDGLNDSWVDLGETYNNERVTPPIASLHLQTGEMAKLLWEAQKESLHSSYKGSGSSSKRESPKSPPHSPNTECSGTGSEIEILNIYLNSFRDDLPIPIVERSTHPDYFFDWNSRPDQCPPKEWKFRQPNSGLSMRHSKAMKSGFFSAEVFSLVMLTNLVSLLIGAGLGFYFGKRLSVQVVPVALD